MYTTKFFKSDYKGDTLNFCIQETNEKDWAVMKILMLKMIDRQQVTFALIHIHKASLLVRLLILDQEPECSKHPFKSLIRDVLNRFSSPVMLTS
ncbi:hypothetical protein DERF_006934 [Dermatophagoides farinae]|uniref:Uncharacterized protein n=1 Tax=Dermatophagoides farinae TaxID=6954 RepID=A0A922HWX1_DERFA|nr:hypothetical protein DERF_006934 [Dermatophagoides farinae]